MAFGEMRTAKRLALASCRLLESCLPTSLKKSRDKESYQLQRVGGALGDEKTLCEQDEFFPVKLDPRIQTFNQNERNAYSCVIMILGNLAVIFINVLCLVGNCEN